MDFDFKPARRPVKSVKAEPANPIPPLNTETPDTDTFHTPEEVAGQQADTRLSSAIGGHAVTGTQGKKDPLKSRLRRKFALRWPPGKKEMIAAAVLIVVCSLSGVIINAHRTTPKPVAAVAAKPARAAAKPKIVYSNLSGLPLADPTANDRPVTGVMIENSVQARPQAGLSQASVVFEAIAEGGITRFLALYQDTAPDNIGPIRSARPYYAQWALGFDAGYAHVGGSPEALQNIKDWNVRDLDQFHNSGAYHRISQRAAPHNMYSGIAALNALETSKGITASKFTGFPRKSEEPSKAPTAKSININISGPLYNTHYDYNPAANSYNRSEGGAPHVDSNSNAQISPKVVIAMVVPYSLEADHYHSSYASIGSGAVFIFQDGIVTTGTWTKSSNNAQVSFTDAAGKEIKLNPGQTWLTAVSSNSNVTYAP